VRPHLHLYVGLPNSMAAEDYAGLRERTLQRHRLERQYGRYEGRKRTPPLGIPYGGDFGRWLRAAWSETVGTTGPAAKVTADAGSAAHEVRGAAVAVMFWSDEAEAKTDRTVVAQYLAREAGKWRQKQPPPGFVKVGRFYGVWGKSAGFHPEATTIRLEPLVAAEVEARLARWVNGKLHTLRKGAPPATRWPFATAVTALPPSGSVPTRRPGLFTGRSRPRTGSRPRTPESKPGAQPPATCSLS
jgi:hypothetical protein